MHAFDLVITFESPIATGASLETTSGVDRLLPRDRKLGRPVLPGTLLRGNLRDALTTLAQRGSGRFPGLDGHNATKLIGDLFGRRSGAAREGDGLDVKANGPDNEPRRGYLVIEDLIATADTPRDLAKTITRIAIDPTLGTAREGALQVIESPWPIGDEIDFKGRVLVSRRIDVEVAERVLCLGLSALDALGAHKSAGFGKVVRTNLRRARTPELPKARLPDIQPRAWRLVLSLDRSFLVSAERVAPNIFRGQCTISGGVIKGAFAEALAGELNANPNLRALLSRTVFSAFLPSTKAPAAAIAAPRALPVPFSVAYYDGKGSKAVVRDTAFDVEPMIRDTGNGRFVAPLFEVDWKTAYHRQVRATARRAGILLLPAPDAVPRDIRVRTAINYGTGTALYDEASGGSLFVYSAVEPALRVEDGSSNAETPAVFIGDLVASRPDTAEVAALADLIARLVKVDAWVGKTDTPAHIVAVGEAPPQKPRPTPVRRGDRLFYALVLATPALMTPLDQLRQADGDVRLVYHMYFEGRTGSSGLRLERAIARQRLVGGYQAMRFPSSPTCYEPWIVTEPGSVFVLSTTLDRQTAAEDWIREKALVGLPEAGISGPDEDRWRQVPFARTNGYGAIAPSPWTSLASAGREFKSVTPLSS